MQKRIIDWAAIIFMIIFAPFLLVVLYMVVTSSVSDLDHIIWYVYFYLLTFAWILLNNLLGYSLNTRTKIFRFPSFFSLLRPGLNLADIICYRLIGFDEFATTDNGRGFRSFRLVLKSHTRQYEIIFNREIIARKVLKELKGVLPTECSLERIDKH